MKIFINLLLLSLLALAGCNFEQKQPQTADMENLSDYIPIADTIITDVLILNPNTDEWTDYSLRNLDKKTLVNEIFESVYHEDLIPYEFFHNKPLTIDDIKELEKDPEFSRDKIAKVQFEEAWYYDPTNQKMIKKVIELLVFITVFN